MTLITTDWTRALLRAGHEVLSPPDGVGRARPGRLHDVIVHAEPITPGAPLGHGAGLTIHTGVHPTPFGDALIAITARGICHLSFVDRDDDVRERLAALRNDWPAAAIVADDQRTAPIAARVFGGRQDAGAPLAVHLTGTDFQLAVWRTLLRIPPGTAVSYRDVAAAVGRPAATRAVGTAVGDNPIWYLIPCHRVLRSDGGLGGYAGGLERKVVMLARESTAIV